MKTYFFFFIFLCSHIISIQASTIYEDGQNQIALEKERYGKIKSRLFVGMNVQEYMLYMIAEGACSQIKFWKADEITVEVINEAAGRYICLKGIQWNVADQYFQWVYTDFTPNVLPNYQQIAPSTRN